MNAADESIRVRFHDLRNAVVDQLAHFSPFQAPLGQVEYGNVNAGFIHISKLLVYFVEFVIEREFQDGILVAPGRLAQCPVTLKKLLRHEMAMDVNNHENTS